MKIINLQSGRRQQLSKHKCLQGEYVDHFLQFSASQRATGEIKTCLAKLEDGEKPNAGTASY